MSSIVKVGIRQEDKSHWERRVVLIPKHVEQSNIFISVLKENKNIQILVQKSSKRVYSDKEYQDAGAILTDNITDCQVILGVKEIPIAKLYKDKTFMFFSHTFKGQEDNMQALDHMIKNNIRLIDYERIVNENNERKIAFGRFAGIAGAIDFFAGLGQFILTKGYQSPLLHLNFAYKYVDLEDVYSHYKKIGEVIKQTNGIPEELQPLIIAITGSGRCSKGSLEAVEKLGVVEEVLPEDLEALVKSKSEKHAYTIYITKIFQQHLVQNKYNKQFHKAEYYENPNIYEPIFHVKYLPYVSCILHNIFWNYQYPRMITKDQLSELASKDNLRLIGISDITADIDGSIEILEQYTTPDKPFFTYSATDQSYDYENLVSKNKHDIFYQSVDFLPCELAKDASNHFSEYIKDILPNVCHSEQFRYREVDQQELLPELQKAVETNNCQLAPDYMYIEQLRKANDSSMKSLKKSLKSELVLKVSGHIFDTHAINAILDIIESYQIKFILQGVDVGRSRYELSNAIIKICKDDTEEVEGCRNEIFKLAGRYQLKAEIV